MAVAITELEEQLIELSSESFETFCNETGAMLGIEMQAEAKESSTCTIKELKKEFKKLVAINTVLSKGSMPGKFQILFDKDAMFTLGGVIVMQPENRILENRKMGTADAAKDISDAVGEIANMLIGFWDRVFREDFDGHEHFMQTNNFIGNPWSNPNEEIGFSGDQEQKFLVATYQVTVGSLPPFTCAALFPHEFINQSSEAAEEPPASEETATAEQPPPEEKQPEPEQAATETKEPEPQPEVKAEPEPESTESLPTEEAKVEDTKQPEPQPEAVEPPPVEEKQPEPKPEQPAEPPQPEAEEAKTEDTRQPEPQAAEPEQAAETETPPPEAKTQPEPESTEPPPTEETKVEDTKQPEPQAAPQETKQQAAEPVETQAAEPIISESIQQIAQSPANLPGETNTAYLKFMASDIMQRQLVWASPDDSVQQADTKMQQSNSGYLMVGDNNQLEGVLATSDLAGAMSPYLRPIFAKWRRPLDDATLQIKIKWIMSKQVQTVKRDATLGTIIQQMSRLSVKCLPVLNDQGQPEGLITVFDLFNTLLKFTN